MKLSHAASRLRTAIAELTRTIGVGSGALLGHWSNLINHRMTVWYQRRCERELKLETRAAIMRMRWQKALRKSIRNELVKEQEQQSRHTDLQRQSSHKRNHPNQAQTSGSEQSEDTTT